MIFFVDTKTSYYNIYISSSEASEGKLSAEDKMTHTKDLLHWVNYHW